MLLLGRVVYLVYYVRVAGTAPGIARILVCMFVCDRTSAGVSLLHLSYQQGFGFAGVMVLPIKVWPCCRMVV